MTDLSNFIKILFISSLLFLNTRCESPRCNDGLLNGNETEIDCGGVCGPCYTCDDGIQNQDEYGIDCGGSCQPCPNDAIAFPLPEASRILGLFFFNSGIGYVLSDRGNIYKTTNGGEQLEQLSLPVQVHYFGSELRFYFYNEQLGFYHTETEHLGLNTLYRTADGGSNWQQINWKKNRESIMDMVFLDEQTGLMTTQYRNPNNANEVAGFIYRSTDGGMNWTLVLETAPHFKENQTALGLENIDKIDSQNLIATAGNLIFTSEDAGKNWKLLSSSAFDFWAGTLEMLDKQKGYIITEQDFQRGGFYKTENGGLNWTEVIFDTPFGSYPNLLPYHYYFKNENEGILLLNWAERPLYRHETNTDKIAPFGAFNPAIFTENYLALSMSVTDDFVYVGTDNGWLAKVPL